MKLLIIGLLFLSSTLLYASNVRVFQLKTQLKDQVINCSATLINYDGNCTLLTNHHCLMGHQGKTNIILPSLKQKEHLVTIEKSNSNYDLAKLTIPNIIEEKVCPKLEPIKEITPKEFKGPLALQVFTSIGYINNKSQYFFTGNSNWNETKYYARSRVKFKYVHPEFQYLEISQLKSLPGMSGGAVVSEAASFVGLITQFVPYQDYTWAIPGITIKKFLAGKKPRKYPIQLKNKKRAIQKNSHFLAGENSRADGGENSRADGGENSRVDGSKKVRAQFLSVVEPDEGIISAHDPSEIILGFKSWFNYYQIDGVDDYILKAQGISKKNLITRNLNGHLPFELRKSIMSRLQGHYRIKPYSYATKNEIPYAALKESWFLNRRMFHFLFDFEAWHYTYDFNSSDPILKNSPLRLGQTAMEIDITEDEINIFQYEYRQYKGKSPDRLAKKHQRKDTTYSISYSKDYKKVFLKSNQEEYSCDNKYLLKLICLSNEGSLSFSLSATKNGQLKTRIIKPTGYLKQLDFTFSTLYQVKSKTRLVE